ncbi:unnamed protein product [Choristocarpus tenellus]
MTLPLQVNQRRQGRVVGRIRKVRPMVKMMHRWISMTSRTSKIPSGDTGEYLRYVDSSHCGIVGEQLYSKKSFLLQELCHLSSRFKCTLSNMLGKWSESAGYIVRIYVPYTVIEAILLLPFQALKHDFQGLRGGKADPGMLDHLKVDMYGSSSNLSEAAQVSMKGPQLMVLTVYDPGMTEAVAEAVRYCDMGLNPSVDGETLVTVPIPKTTKESRDAVVKVAAKHTEKVRVLDRLILALRHILESCCTVLPQSVACCPHIFSAGLLIIFCLIMRKDCFSDGIIFPCCQRAGLFMTPYLFCLLTFRLFTLHSVCCPPFDPHHCCG